VKNKKLQNITFNPRTTKWLNPLEARQGQKQLFSLFPRFGGAGGRAKGKGESKEWLVSNSNIVQKGEREQMAVENAASKPQRKGLF